MEEVIRLIYGYKCYSGRAEEDMMPGDALYGLDSNPREIQRWSADEIDAAKAALEGYISEAWQRKTVIGREWVLEVYGLEQLILDDDGDEIECEVIATAKHKVTFELLGKLLCRRGGVWSELAEQLGVLDKALCGGIDFVLGYANSAEECGKRLVDSISGADEAELREWCGDDVDLNDIENIIEMTAEAWERCRNGKWGRY